ncbi:hypothetical protein [Candidatus Bandiella euplotis]|uniref:hypothetical protein n=1 Tax=Candidatus Bandiella euplotis TaxID=1664265 RepID=UPI002B256BA5|nr:hypothetical protein [Candidatus Bandiella woodruffii]
MVKELGIESIKPLNEAGFDFSKLYSHHVEALVKELGEDVRKILLQPGNIPGNMDEESFVISNQVNNASDPIIYDASDIMPDISSPILYLEDHCYQSTCGSTER